MPRYEIIYSDKAFKFEKMFDQYVTTGYATFEFKDEFIIVTCGKKFLKIIYDIELRLCNGTNNTDHEITRVDTNIAKEDVFHFIENIPYSLDRRNTDSMRLPDEISYIFESAKWNKSICNPPK